jgi:hypothetical protein
MNVRVNTCHSSEPFLMTQQGNRDGAGHAAKGVLKLIRRRADVNTLTTCTWLMLIAALQPHQVTLVCGACSPVQVCRC